ncbi:MAG: NitT/TauT family transport system ATP-binding protein [Bacillota bacterium]|nr:MAG: NitT/TauT family transport system ATP-binding protein [Bacillota bacterium]MBS3949155.1 ABC transporter ATP-binding protein [Peptococcaceae bacterium]
MTVAVQRLTKSFGTLSVFQDFNLEFPCNQITCILGPSGAGKTTLLNILSGLLVPDSGQVLGLDGEAVSYLFQEPRLLPWKSVRGNFDFVLATAYPDMEERTAVVEAYLKLVELADFAEYYPAQLSGGMKQRVAIARAFAYPSKILLMDEPFKALDMQLKYSLMADFIELWQEDKRTVVCVTHDPEEALYLGDRICVFSSLPARVHKEFSIDLPRESRKHHDQRLSDIRLKLLNLLLGETS